MIRCVFLRSTNVSVVSNIVVTEMIEKIHPRHFLNLSCKEKIEPFSAKIGPLGSAPKNHGRAEVRGGSARTIHVRIGTIWAFLPQESTGRFSIGVDGGRGCSIGYTQYPPEGVIDFGCCTERGMVSNFV